MTEPVTRSITGTNPTTRGSLALKAAFVLLHVVPLLLASTAFTLVTAPFGYSSFNWNYFAYAHQNGFGYTYHSDYSLPQVLTYLLAYGSGLILYPLLLRPPLLAGIATLACLAGTISFTIELSHWVSDHHLSLIASFPILLLPAALWTIITFFWPCPAKDAGASV